MTSLKGEWEEMKLNEIEIVMECKASVPYKPHSGVWALSEGQWEAIKRKLSVETSLCVRLLQLQVREWARRRGDWGQRYQLG